MGRAGNVCVALGVGAVLAGCSGTYEMNIANTTSHPVNVSLTCRTWYAGEDTLLNERIGPGDSARLGPISAPAGRVELQARAQGIASPKAVLVVHPGETTAHLVGATLPGGIAGIQWQLVGQGSE